MIVDYVMRHAQCASHGDGLRITEDSELEKELTHMSGANVVPSTSKTRTMCVEALTRLSIPLLYTEAANQNHLMTENAEMLLLVGRNCSGTVGVYMQCLLESHTLPRSYG